MKRVGLLGGAFNPIHLGHLAMAQCALEQLKLDQVVFIPSNISPHKGKEVLAAPKDRLKMVRLAVKGNDKFSASYIELKRNGVSYTVDTVKVLLENAKTAVKYFFLIGEDNYKSLGSWKNIDELLQLIQFAVIQREGFSVKNKAIKAKFIKMPIINISSSFIRKSIAKGDSVKYYVPHKVNDYILKNNLYKFNGNYGKVIQQ